MATAATEITLGKWARIFIGTTSLRWQSAELAIDPGAIPAGSNLSQGAREVSPSGEQTMEINVTAQYRKDDPTNFLIPPIELIEGEYIEDVYFYPDIRDSLNFWYMTVAMIGPTNVTAQGTADVTYRINLKNHGDFYTPANRPV